MNNKIYQTRRQLQMTCRIWSFFTQSGRSRTRLASAKSAERPAALPVVGQPLETARPRTEGRTLPSVVPVSGVPPVPVSGLGAGSLQTKAALQTPAEPASGLRQSSSAPRAKQLVLPGQPPSQVWVQNWPRPTKFLQRPAPHPARAARAARDRPGLQPHARGLCHAALRPCGPCKAPF
jgi:hypothetical protein